MWRYSEEGFESAPQGWAEMSTYAMFGGLFTGFLQRGFVLYTSQIERLRSIAGQLAFDKPIYGLKRMVHTLVRLTKPKELFRLFMAPLRYVYSFLSTVSPRVS